MKRGRKRRETIDSLGLPDRLEAVEAEVEEISTGEIIGARVEGQEDIGHHHTDRSLLLFFSEAQGATHAPLPLSGKVRGFAFWEIVLTSLCSLATLLFNDDRNPNCSYVVLLFCST